MTALFNAIYILLFSLNALSFAIVSALTGGDWNNYTPTQKFVIVSSITGTLTNALLALSHQLARKVKKGETLLVDTNGTEQISKSEVPKVPPVG